ncbi:MAG: Gfo/Idh/MocA family oxidoreductase [Acidobacteria bacterium]|nr:Gfo/Idh/MocA family oxidoreductase [Acidobacteriota bacterium]MBA3884215.1 Gfo/Idh/MocA family oxidoreductase [Acidobacteriota bacterium]
MIRIGVIGLGVMGEQYVRILQAHNGASVTAVSTRRTDRLVEVATQHGVEHRYTDYRELLQSGRVDAVCVATPDSAHAGPVRAALEAGLHVLCEKPFTTSLPEADDLLRLARQRPRQKLQVAFNHRWLSSYHQGAAAIRRGEIGRPVAASARKNDTIFVPTEMIAWAAETTPMHFLGAHDIDLVRWYLAAEPVEVFAAGSRGVLAARGVETWDVIQALVKFEGGITATFEAAWIYPNTFPTLTDSFVEVIGTEGHLHFDRKRESVEMSTARQFTYPKTFLLAEVFGRTRGAVVECLSDFVSAIREDREPQVTALDGRQVSAVLDAVSRSLDTGRPAAVDPPETV